MRFRLLGPIAVDDIAPGGAVPGGARLRVLLAALLLRANVPVSRSVLAEAVWDGRPPSGAEGSLRSYVLRLRRALGPEAGARIVVHDPGYLIRLAPSELDVLEFEALCRETGSALRAADWDEASSAGARAVELWRGEPLLDVPAQLLRNEFAPRLEQLLVQVREDCIEANLQLGQHARLVAQLRELTAVYPLRERFHAQLMLALARGGRRSEALEAYQHARRILVDQLGIEPGSELRDLHRRVLAGELEPAAAATPSPAGTASAAPRQLPAAVQHFIGRQTEVNELTRLLDETSAAAGTVVISAIDGMAGIGKTALAVHTAHRLAEKFPDGQLFLDLRGYTQGQQPRAASEALDWLLRGLGVSPARIPKDSEQATALYRERLADTRTLIVLDNAATEAQVRPLLPGGGSCLVLITSRRRLRGLDDARTLSLDLLSAPDAVALLRAVAGPERIPADDPRLGEVAELCGHLPLALRIAGALLRHRPAWPLEHLAGLLRDPHRRVPALADGDRDLATVFDLSYTGLDEQHRRLWRRLGLVPGSDLDAYAAASLVEVDPAAAAALLEDLVDHNLLIEYSPGRYRLHDLMRDHARNLAATDPEAERVSALDRLLHYYAFAAQSASIPIARYPRPAPEGPAPAHLPAWPDPEAARAWLRVERGNLEAAYSHARALNLDEHALALAAGLAVLLRSDGPFARALDLYRAAAETAERLGRTAAHAMALTDLGILRRLAGDLAGSGETLQQALEIYRAIGHQLGETTALTELGIVERVTGDLAMAGAAFAQAVDIYRAIGHRSGEATALTDLGIVRRQTGDLVGSAETLTQALEIYRAIGHRSGEATTLTDLGFVQQTLGNLAGAADSHARAVEIARETGHRHGEGLALTRLGAVLRLAGNLVGAGEALRQGLEIYREVGHRSGEAYALSELGVVQQLIGDLAGAVDAQTRALEIYRAIGHRGNEASVLNRYAAVIAASGDRPRAFELYQQALAMNRELNKPDDEAISLEGIAEHHLATGDRAQGAAYLGQALEVYQRLGMERDVHRVQERLDGLRGDGASAD